MQSNYKRIGDYIRRVKLKNTDDKLDLLLGININKYFMPSVANIVETNLARYKVVKSGQFACNRMHVGRDSRLPIALSKFDYDFIISPAYDVFEIIDTDILIPEYLMMWFSRSEFDRNSWFYTDTDVRGKLGWDSFCDMKLPIPTIEKQNAIVAEYNTVVNRIKLNEQLNQKLEETAQAIYKHWFVDFEFPNEEGKPYKSSGGKMVWNEELEKEVPDGWENGCLNNLSTQYSGFSFKGDKYSFDEGITVVRGENVTEKRLRWDTHKKWNLEIDDRMKKCYLEANDIVIGMDGSKVGKNWALVSELELPLLLAQRVTSVRGNNLYESFYLYLSLLVLNFEEYVSQVQTGTSVPHISGQQIKDFPLLIPKETELKMFDSILKAIFKRVFLNIGSSKRLEEMKDLLLSNMTKVEVEKEVEG